MTINVYTGEGDVFPETKVETKENDDLYFEIHVDSDIIKINLKLEDDILKGKGSNNQGKFTPVAKRK